MSKKAATTKTPKATTKKATKPKAKAGKKKAIAAAKADAAATAKPAKEAKTPKAGKGATILSLIARDGGATATELQQATGWQAHSVRGFLSTATKKGLAKITSAKREDGQRVYTGK